MWEIDTMEWNTILLLIAITGKMTDKNNKNVN